MTTLVVVRSPGFIDRVPCTSMVIPPEDSMVGAVLIIIEKIMYQCMGGNSLTRILAR